MTEVVELDMKEERPRKVTDIRIERDYVISFECPIRKPETLDDYKLEIWKDDKRD